MRGWRFSWQQLGTALLFLGLTAAGIIAAAKWSWWWLIAAAFSFVAGVVLTVVQLQRPEVNDTGLQESGDRYTNVNFGDQKIGQQINMHRDPPSE